MPTFGETARKVTIYHACVVMGILIGFAPILTTRPAAAAPPRDALDQVVVPSAERMTRDLVALGQRYAAAPSAERLRLTHRLVRLATLRQQLLSTLIEDAPEEVLRVALPAALRATLPRAVRTKVEEEVEQEGQLEVWVEDYDRGHRYRHFLRSRGQRLSLHFAGKPPQLPTGSWVQVRGVRVKRALALASSGSVQVTAAAAMVPNTFGAQSTAVILVNFQDNPTQPYTPAYAQQVVFTATSNFYRELSYQQTWLTGTVVGWYTIALASTVCDPSTVAGQAYAAAIAAGVDLSGYARLVYAHPQNACGWWGLGTVGGNPSHVWVNGDLQLRVVGHELGHSFGLFHSHSLDCGAAPIGSNCTAAEYGDTLDMMGGTSAHFNAFQKERLGWLNDAASPPLTTVEANGTYWITPYEAGGASPVALKIRKAIDATTGLSTWYYAEYRQPIGFDSFLASNSNVVNGLVIHTGSEVTADSSYLLDMTPETTSWTDPALSVGRSFYDPDADVTITLASVSNSGAAVTVNLGRSACVRGYPSVDLQMQAANYTWTVSVTNNDSPGCVTTRYALQAAVSSGWAATFATPSLDVAPGTTASTTLEVIPPTGPAGLELQVTATNSSDPSFSASATVAAQ